MTKIAGKEVSKNTMVSASIGTILAAFIAVWTVSGLGRPLFAADLERIEEKIDAYQTSTAVQILFIRREALQSDLRVVKRAARKDGNDPDSLIDIDEIQEDIKVIDAKIACHRTKDCEVESEI